MLLNRAIGGQLQPQRGGGIDQSQGGENHTGCIVPQQYLSIILYDIENGRLHYGAILCH